ncbi:Gfo/Idh/MocA family oxidoreductase [Paenibacillus thiaminolyticus]
MSQLRTGIISCGGIANAKHLPALANMNDLADMTAFCDIIPERSELAAKQYGAAGAKTYMDYRQLLDDPSNDVVHVLTPNSSHAVITVAALEAVKHVMCEKPMVINSQEAHKMYRRYRQNGMRLPPRILHSAFCMRDQSAVNLALAEHNEQFAGTYCCQFGADDSRPWRAHCQHRHAAVCSRIRQRRSAAKFFMDDGAVRLGCCRLVLHYVREYA